MKINHVWYRISWNRFVYFHQWMKDRVHDIKGATATPIYLPFANWNLRIRLASIKLMSFLFTSFYKCGRRHTKSYRFHYFHDSTCSRANRLLSEDDRIRFLVCIRSSNIPQPSNDYNVDTQYGSAKFTRCICKYEWNDVHFDISLLKLKLFQCSVVIELTSPLIRFTSYIVCHCSFSLTMDDHFWARTYCDSSHLFYSSGFEVVWNVLWLM